MGRPSTTFNSIVERLKVRNHGGSREENGAGFLQVPFRDQAAGGSLNSGSDRKEIKSKSP